jgi:hypothetical protein
MAASAFRAFFGEADRFHIRTIRQEANEDDPRVAHTPVALLGGLRRHSIDRFNKIRRNGSIAADNGNRLTTGR